MKKLFWMPLAVLAVFALAFVGCGGGGGDPDPGPDPDEFDKVMLGDFNTWGGDPAKQSGWGTKDFTWDDDSVTPKKEGAVVEDKGYKLDDFQKAKYLVLKLKSGQPAGGIQFIWGGSGATDEESTAIGGWHQANITSDAGVATASMGATKEGDELTIELSKAFKDVDYDKYLDVKTTAVRLIVAYYTGAGLADLFDEAWLLVGKEKPDVEPDLPPPETAAIYTAKDGWSTGVSSSSGTHTANTGFTITAGDNSGKPTYTLEIEFSPALDINKFAKFVVEWDGVHDDFKQMQWNYDFTTGKKGDTTTISTQGQTPQWQAKTDVGLTLFDDTTFKDWGSNKDGWDIVDGKLTKLKLFSDFVQYDDGGGDWAVNLPFADAESFVLKSFEFVEKDD